MIRIFSFINEKILRRTKESSITDVGLSKLAQATSSISFYTTSMVSSIDLSLSKYPMKQSNFLCPAHGATLMNFNFPNNIHS